MATTQEYLSQLQTDKQTLVDNLVTKGVNASNDESFTSLVPKVLDIESGSDIEINDASYLFYGGARLNNLEILLDACKNVTSCSNMFYDCTELTSVDLSNFDTANVTTMYNMFNLCRSLEKIDLSNFDVSKVTSMNSMFYNCNSLSKVIIDNQTVFDLKSKVFLGTPIDEGTGFIYVPDNLVETYKSATNWSAYADQIKGMSELPPEEAQ